MKKNTRDCKTPFWFEGDIKKITLQNLFYRRAIYTGPHSQLVLMSIVPGGETGEERREEADKIVFIIKGKAQSVLNKRSRDVGKHDVVFIPAGSLHNLKNSGRHDLKLFAVYSPALYSEGTVHKTAADSLEDRTKEAWQHT